MLLYLVNDYLNRINNYDLIKFAKFKNIDISVNDSIVLYEFLKTNASNILNKRLDVFTKLNGKIDASLYTKIIILYTYIINKYKK